MKSVSQISVGWVLAVALCGGGYVSSVQAQENPVRATPITPGSPVRANPIVPAGANNEPEVQTAPGDPLFEFANLLYQRQRYADAVQKYDQFLRVSSGSPNAKTAWFRLAVSYQQLGKEAEARTCYETIVKEFPQSQYAPSAAFIMAVHTFNEDNFEDAIPFWNLAIGGLSEPDKITQCRFFLARSYHELDRVDEAIPQYEAVTLDANAGEFGERAAMELAWLAFEADNKEDALAKFRRVRETSKNPEYVIEATTQEALLNLELGNTDAANQLFERLLDAEDPALRQKAQLALIFQAWEAQDYERVVDVYGRHTMDFGKDVKTATEVSMLVAHSFRNLNNHAAALGAYQNIANLSPKTAIGGEAGYYALQCRYILEDETLPEAVDRYVVRQTEVDPESEYLDLAFLMAGDVYFSRANLIASGENVNPDILKSAYEGAANAFQRIRLENVAETNVPTVHYKLGWSWAETGKLEESADALGKFLATAPEDPSVPSALIKRATVYQDLELPDEAIRDYRNLAENHPDSEFAEFALQQIASIHAQRHQRKEMIAAYRTLIERFPNTSVLDQAWFYIGGGHFEHQEYEGAIEPLTNARKLNPEQWDEAASLRIVVSWFHVNDLDQLLAETNRFRERNFQWADSISLPIYLKLGRDLFDSGRYDDAIPYLTLAGNDQAPEQTSPDIWEKLFIIFREKQDWSEAVAAMAKFLVHPHSPSIEARARLDKAECHLELNQIEPARELAVEVLKLIPQGTTNAEARILLGDLKRQEQKPAEAAAYYVIVADLFEDPTMTPLAIQRLIHVLEEQGDTAKANSYRETLRSRYPNYSAE